VEYSDERFDEEERKERAIVLPGKDEMNLAEFPIASLRRRGDSRDSFTYEGWITNKDGKRQRQRWIVRGLSGIGLPTEYDERVLVALMAITSSHGFEDRKVPFSVYQVLQVMGLTDSKRDYENIERSLERLVGVTIFAEGAFWDNGEKSWVKIKTGFHIIEKFWLRYLEEDEQVLEEELVPGYITWSEDIWKSIQDGYIKNLDLAFYYSLQSPMARRLYRFLDKRMAYRAQFEIDIFEMASRLGMTHYAYPSKVLEKLQPALDELMERGFLVGAEVVKVKKYTRMHFTRATEALAAQGVTRLVETRARSPDSPATTPAVPPDGAEDHALTSDVIAALMERGFSERIAGRLASSYEGERILQKLDYLRWEEEVNGRHVRSPRGWLRRAIEEDYGPPEGFDAAMARAAQLELIFAEEPEPYTTATAASDSNRSEREMWKGVLRDIETQTTRATYENLFTKTLLVSVDHSVAVVGVPNPMVQEWLENRMRPLIASALERRVGHALTLRFEVV
jgi:plasmid replication initiation protein